ncbi:MAG: glycosyltransferase, partial [Myxococcales bacterium]|nr:glycosyltransferase [Myxococcales bacterium]
EFEDVAWPDERSKTIIAAGRLAPVKRFEDLVRAWAVLAKDFPDWNVKIFGSGPEEGRLRGLIETLDLRASVFLMGHARDMKSAYLDAEILAHPAAHEGFGLSVAEGLSCGLPVVAYADCDGVNEFVRTGYNGLMVDREGGAEAYAAALRQLIEKPALRRELRANTRGSVAHFTSAAFLDAWTSILKDLEASK